MNKKIVSTLMFADLSELEANRLMSPADKIYRDYENAYFDEFMKEKFEQRDIRCKANPKRTGYQYSGEQNVLVYYGTLLEPYVIIDFLLKQLRPPRAKPEADTATRKPQPRKNQKKEEKEENENKEDWVRFVPKDNENGFIVSEEEVKTPRKKKPIDEPLIIVSHQTVPYKATYIFIYWGRRKSFTGKNTLSYNGFLPRMYSLKSKKAGKAVATYVHNLDPERTVYPEPGDAQGGALEFMNLPFMTKTHKPVGRPTDSARNVKNMGTHNAWDCWNDTYDAGKEKRIQETRREDMETNLEQYQDQAAARKYARRTAIPVSDKLNLGLMNALKTSEPIYIQPPPVIELELPEKDKIRPPLDEYGPIKVLTPMLNQQSYNGIADFVYADRLAGRKIIIQG